MEVTWISCCVDVENGVKVCSIYRVNNLRKLMEGVQLETDGLKLWQTAYYKLASRACRVNANECVERV